MTLDKIKDMMLSADCKELKDLINEYPDLPLLVLIEDDYLSSDIYDTFGGQSGYAKIEELTFVDDPDLIYDWCNHEDFENYLIERFYGKYGTVSLDYNIPLSCSITLHLPL